MSEEMEIIKVENLCKIYGSGNNEVKALDGVSMGVPRMISVYTAAIHLKGGNLDMRSRAIREPRTAPTTTVMAARDRL